MDVIGFSEAATANSRIEIINANPDSSSGIVTVPSTIATGETITIPTGRVAVLPNVQIDGVLNIENGGEVFVPSGATFGDLETQLALKAPLSSPVLTGTPTAPTPTAGDNSTKVATTAYVDGKMVRGTAVTASGTSIDFTGIPSWVKRITVMFDGVSTNGTSNHLVRLGDSGGVETSGYISNLTGVAVGGSGIGETDLTSFLCGVGGNASNIFTGSMVIDNISGTTWICSTTLAGLNSTFTASGGGSKTLTGTLDRIRITTANGTDTFDAGQINILYEG